MGSGIEIRAKAPAPPSDLDPLKLEFGRTFAPLWFSCAYEKGAWQSSSIGLMENIALHPAAMVLHYGQAIFEGMKAYKWQDGSVALFRPQANAARFNRSATRMAMPQLNEKTFTDSIAVLTDQLREWVPRHPGSLYIRPCMIASEACIGVRTSAQYLYFVIAMPSGAYFSAPGQTGAGTVKVYVTTSVARAAPGGTGNVKAAVNYAVTLKVTGEAKAQGCSQVLFLDSGGKRQIEEMGGMNVFFISGKKLLTPKLTDTFLAGITRDSVIKLATTLGYEVEETELNFDKLCDDIRKGAITEAFACGTAAVIAGIQSFLIDGKDDITIGPPAPGPVTSALYDKLTGIQYGAVADPFGWMVKV